MSTINLGDLLVCTEAVILPLMATETGTWAFMTTFNGAYQYVQFQAVENEPLVVPVKLNEHYTYTFKLYRPDTSVFNDSSYIISTIPMLPEVDYVCPATSENDISIITGKLQFTASENQAEIVHLELQNVKDVAVFVEGAMLSEGQEVDEYILSSIQSKVIFNTPLIEGQKITILYFK